MTKKIKFLFVAFLCSIYVASLQGQSIIPATGGNATGSGGSVSFTIGQITYQTLSGTSGTIAQGVQQPYEISVVTVIENTEGITLEYKVYPNPTRGLITLTIKPYNNENLRYRLYDLNGLILQDKKVISDETEISMESLNPAIYFLKVLKDNKEVKVFKIVKK
jgi:hypothetical protein